MLAPQEVGLDNVGRAGLRGQPAQGKALVDRASELGCPACLLTGILVFSPSLSNHVHSWDSTECLLRIMTLRKKMGKWAELRLNLRLMDAPQAFHC